MKYRFDDLIFLALAQVAGVSFLLYGLGMNISRLLLGVSGMLITAGVCALICRSWRIPPS